MAEKTEKPTPGRQQKSAKKGQTFKSKDVIITCTLISCFIYMYFFFNFTSFVDFYKLVLINSGTVDSGIFFKTLFGVFIRIFIPFFALCAAVTLLATLLQTRFVVATEAIKLNFEALNPVQGFKKIFNVRTIKELIKALLYLLVFSATCYYFIRNDLHSVLIVYRSGYASIVYELMILSRDALILFFSFAFFVLIADAIAEYFLYFKDQKMDKHEVKQERKENEGSPEIKKARREARNAFLSGQEKAAIRNSELLLVNPTHIALGIYFNPDVALLPFIALRLTNFKAKAAIAYARKQGIPVVQDISLARGLYRSYQQFSFISINDDALIKVMHILIWLKQVEVAGMETDSGEAPSP